MSINAPFHIDIPKRGQHCSLGNETFIPGAEIQSALKETTAGAYERHDYCLSCWEKLGSQNVHKGFSTSWRSKMALKRIVSDLPKQREARAMAMLKAALLRAEQLDIEEAFVLSLYLARKRLLFFRQEMVLESGERAFLYEAAESEEMLCVLQISLSSLEVEKIKNELASKFNIYGTRAT
jgi:hypothetical protein